MTTPSTADDLISVADAAAIARRSAGWVREQAACGRIDSVRGTRLLVSQHDMMDLMRQLRPKPRGPVPYLRLIVDNTRR
jgi:hypothetical protein